VLEADSGANWLCRAGSGDRGVAATVRGSRGARKKDVLIGFAAARPSSKNDREAGKFCPVLVRCNIIFKVD